MKYFVIGPQGSGKGTQAVHLAKKFDIPHLGAGDMLRAEKASGSDLGKEIAALIDRGKLVPSEMVWTMVKQQLEQHPEGWILDGYPRTLDQADLLDEEHKPDTVILLDVHDEVCVARIEGRRICPVCSKNYHIEYHKPKEAGKCDDDGAALEHRTDDTEKRVRRRLEIYHNKTKKLVDHYADRLVHINGDQEIPVVWAEIEEKLA